MHLPNALRGSRQPSDAPAQALNNPTNYTYPSTYTLGDAGGALSDRPGTATGGGYDLPNAPPPVRIHLKPIAPPSAMGLASYATATFIVATWLTEWYGNPETPFRLWPFVLTFGGFGQFAAGMWAFNARDTLASIFHTMWGSFYIAVSLSLGLMGAGSIPLNDRYDYNAGWGIWMAPLAAFTYVLTAAAMFRDLAWTGTLFTLATGSVFGVLGWFLHSTALIKILGYFWLASSLLALYRVACYVMTEAVPHRDVLPRFRHPARRHHFSKQYHYPYHEPGVVAGN
ncbi:uncharacterized protein SPPG_07681 [Spizellomyces punctatus DAOM BR117]|uniref:GPR1/FUN34/yaaH family protein n=1 Tax=Spizellomyces punctatus (strain DAOM BR117) TaxID=645134 RepID=A0A0L0H5R0_SPIPD|nr:uncharacterized protein SPPG_07681 [Spizellomyces punctatus DAOM BR117]KNC96850.1 hypothetical protein SPPG_07681 [Spizellomyces punctatus DAOM BR117]|eukprot:XP_016604890.1 hypothetical protein SPPG_07681 [Spizellomyces punctatus DAOM BR117]